MQGVPLQAYQRCEFGTAGVKLLLCYVTRQVASVKSVKHVPSRVAHHAGVVVA